MAKSCHSSAGRRPASISRSPQALEHRSSQYRQPVQIERYANIGELTRAAAELIAEDCRRVLAERPDSYTLGLSGGKTPPLMFDALVGLPMPWHRVHVFQVDERVAPAGSEDRNFTQLSDRLLAHVEIPGENVHPMPVESDDLELACRRYEEAMRRVTSGAPLDLLQLGLGDDGHTASLAPGDPILDVSDRDVWHVESFNGLPRMSLTLPLINRARRIVWLATGSARADMCRRLVSGDPTIPSGRVENDGIVLLVDADAGIYL
jgi:6-phosphogluconolactonase